MASEIYLGERVVHLCPNVCGFARLIYTQTCHYDILLLRLHRNTEIDTGGVRRTPFFLDHVRRLFRDHDRRRVGVAPDDGRHNGRVHHPEPGHAVHFEPRADHRLHVFLRPHLARAHRMVYSGGVLHGHACPVTIRPKLVGTACLGRHVHQLGARLSHRRHVHQVRSDFHPCSKTT